MADQNMKDAKTPDPTRKVVRLSNNSNQIKRFAIVTTRRGDYDVGNGNILKDKILGRTETKQIVLKPIKEDGTRDFVELTAEEWAAVQKMPFMKAPEATRQGVAQHGIFGPKTEKRGWLDTNQIVAENLVG